MNSLAPDTKFKFFPQLNKLEDQSWLNSSASFGPPQYERDFQSDSLQNKFLKGLAEAQLLPIKEVFECFEYFAQIRKKVRAPEICDLCCGHGLLGVLFAIFEKSVEKVYLVDKVEPPSRQKLIAIAECIAPWIKGKLVNKSEKISPKSSFIVQGMTVVSAHACGTLTDLCIDIAEVVKGHIALMPCCYPKKQCKAPMTLQVNLGFETAFDVDRTYRLEDLGYQVKWQSIPSCITPMNRVIIGNKA